MEALSDKTCMLVRNIVGLEELFFLDDLQKRVINQISVEANISLYLLCSHLFRTELLKVPSYISAILASRIRHQNGKSPE